MRHIGNGIALLLTLAVVVGLAACGGDDEQATGGSTATEATQEGGGAGSGEQPKPAEEAAVETIVVRGGEPVGGVRELEYEAGDQVRFEVRSDIADEVHVHGYDLTKDVDAGGTVALSFPADIEGIFEVELEEGGVEIAELRVNP